MDKIRIRNTKERDTDKSKVRQTRFTDDIRNHDSDLQDKHDAFVGNLNERINPRRGGSTESGQIARAKVFDAEYKEIAVVVKVNGTDATVIIDTGSPVTVIIDTGSPVTVISRRVFDRIADEY